MRNQLGILFLSLILLVGCENRDTQDYIFKSDLEFNMTLEGKAIGSSTRAVSPDIDLATTGFKVIGYVTEGSILTNEAAKIVPNFFSNVPFTISKKGDKYTTPLPTTKNDDGTNLSLFAWAENAGTVSITGNTGSGATGYPWIDVQMAGENMFKKDIVAARGLNYDNSYVITSVDLDFRHILSKLSFKVKAPAGASVQISSTSLLFAGSSVYQKGRFLFSGGDSLGVWRDLTSYVGTSAITPASWLKPSLKAGAASDLGELMIIPQKVADNFLTIKLTYTFTMNGQTNAAQTRLVTLKGGDLEQGKNYLYTLVINANEITSSSATIAPWRDMETDALPLVSGPMGDVVLLLDGEQEPYTHTDGKQYWLDYSGYNNHCEIMNKERYNGTNAFDITYRPDKKGYEFKRGGFYASYLYNYIKTPDLGTINGNISSEVIAEDYATGWSFSIPLAISQSERKYETNCYDYRALLITTNEDEVNNWDYGVGAPGSNLHEAGRLTHRVPTGFNWSKRAFYSYSRKNNDMVLSTINNQIFEHRPIYNNTNVYKLNHGMIGAAFKGVINYVKIVKRGLSYDEMMEDFDKLKGRFSLEQAEPKYLKPPVTDGLVLCLDGRTGINTTLVSGEKVWADQSGSGRHAIIKNSGISAGPNNNFVSVAGGSNNGHMILRRGFIDMPFYTVEFVVNAQSTASNCLFAFMKDGSNRALYLHFPFYNDGETRIFFDAQDMDTGRSYVNINNLPNKPFTNKVHQYSLSRRPNNPSAIMYQNRAAVSFGKNATNTNSSLPMTSCIIANSEFGSGYPFVGEIYAIRIYNRVLTDAERELNYQYDKETFGF